MIKHTTSRGAGVFARRSTLLVSAAAIALGSATSASANDGDFAPVLEAQDGHVAITAPDPQIVIADPGTPTTARDPVDINGVGQMVADIGGGFIGLCTGSLINPRTVIFAAHCVNDEPATDYGAAPADTSVGRYEKSTGGSDFVLMSKATRDGQNAYPLVGPVVINEVMYNPFGTGREYVELRNVTDAAVEKPGCASTRSRVTSSSASVSHPTIPAALARASTLSRSMPLPSSATRIRTYPASRWALSVSRPRADLPLLARSSADSIP